LAPLILQSHLDPPQTPPPLPGRGQIVLGLKQQGLSTAATVKQASHWHDFYFRNAPQRRAILVTPSLSRRQGDADAQFATMS